MLLAKCHGDERKSMRRACSGVGAVARAAKRLRDRLERGVKEEAADLRPGQFVERGGTLYEVEGTSRSGEGRGGASIHLRLRELRSGANKPIRLKPQDEVERVRLERREHVFLYRDGEMMVLLEEGSMEQPELPVSLLGEQADLLADGCEVVVSFHGDSPVAASLPRRMEVEVSEADAFVKGDTASSSSKWARTSSGASVRVPPHVQAGERIVIDTSDRSFVRRSR